MSNTTHTLRMFLAEARPTAVMVMNTPSGGGLIEWLPRSLIGYARKEQPANPGERPIYIFTLPEWKIEQRNLWSYVTDAK